jgi:hypothetical protein
LTPSRPEARTPEPERVFWPVRPKAHADGGRALFAGPPAILVVFWVLMVEDFVVTATSLPRAVSATFDHAHRGVVRAAY